MRKLVTTTAFLVALVMALGVLPAWSAGTPDDSWMTNNRWGKWGKDDQVGTLNDVTPAMRLAAIGLIKTGKVYDLETLRFKGMPVWPGHSGWDILPYGSPHGRQTLLKDAFYDAKYNWYAKGGWLDASINKYNVGLNSEMLVGPLHVGTHIDSFSHLTIGQDNHWYNGYNEATAWSNYGPLKADASNIPPIILRGVLLDIPGYKKVAHLEPGYAITAEDIKGCAAWEKVEIKRGDCVLLRTGERWPQMDLAPNAGPDIGAARYLVEEKDIFLIGDDQSAFENFPKDAPSSFPGHMHPVHQYLLIQNGVHLMEMVFTDELAKDKVYEFCFMTLPTKVRGATGMMIRPIAMN